MSWLVNGTVNGHRIIITWINCERFVVLLLVFVIMGFVILFDAWYHLKVGERQMVFEGFHMKSKLGSCWVFFWRDCKIVVGVGLQYRGSVVIQGHHRYIWLLVGKVQIIMTWIKRKKYGCCFVVGGFVVLMWWNMLSLDSCVAVVVAAMITINYHESPACNGHKKKFNTKLVRFSL